MKKIIIILALSLIVPATQLSAQRMLVDSIYGKWVVTEYYKNNKFVTAANSGSIQFSQDGIFSSVGNYFGTKKGTYRTDENRVIVLMDENKRLTTEWKTSVNRDTLELRSVAKRKSPKIYMVLVREKPERASIPE